MPRMFGTDGVRGLANVDITADLALQLGEAAARQFGGARRADGSKPRAIIGRDTRISGEFLDHALAAGLGKRRHGRDPDRRRDHARRSRT